MASLVDLFADMIDETSAELLRRGNEKQEHYVAELLAAIGLELEPNPVRAARVLLDALQGGLFRFAVGGSRAHTPPDQIIDYFLELWKCRNHTPGTDAPSSL
jgi:hypothetical protein